MPQHIGNAGKKAMAWAEHFIVPQTWAHQMLQGEVTNRDNTQVSADPAGEQPESGMLLLASAENTLLTTSQQPGEAQAQTSKRLVSETVTGDESIPVPKINPEAVADRVYRLMRHDLILERERATRLGE